MRVQDVLGSPAGILLGVTIARLTPPRFGYWLANTIASVMARRRANMHAMVRANLRYVLPEAADDELDQLARRAIAHAGRTYFDMFRLSVEDYRSGRVELGIDAEQWEVCQRVLTDRRGTVLVGPHMSNFDLAAQWISAQGVAIQALSLPQPNTGTRVVNALRERRGIEMTPLTVASLRAAVKRLRSGGVVMTGVDRPISSTDEPTLFFGAPAHMPTGHVRLALQTDAHIIVATCILAKGHGGERTRAVVGCAPSERDCAYRIVFGPPLEMERVGTTEENVRHNVRRVLAIIEGMIRLAPDQWLMFVPVWEDKAQPIGAAHPAGAAHRDPTAI